ncbi:hypothetical protein HQ520_06485 [bacterium]|nr:hypothetical protein [bacterium]
MPLVFFAQQNSFLSSEHVYWLLLVIVLLFALIVILMIAHKFTKGRSNRSVLEMDTVFLDTLRDKLAPDEMRRVREAVLKQATTREKGGERATDLTDLQAIAARKREELRRRKEAQGDETEPVEKEPRTPPVSEYPPGEVRQPHASQKRVTSLRDISLTRRSEAEPPKTAEEPEKTSGIDIEALLERGLISREQYEQFKKQINENE